MDVGMRKLLPDEPVQATPMSRRRFIVRIHFASDLMSSARGLPHLPPLKSSSAKRLSTLCYDAMGSCEYHRTINSWQLERYFEIV